MNTSRIDSGLNFQELLSVIAFFSVPRTPTEAHIELGLPLPAIQSALRFLENAPTPGVEEFSPFTVAKGQRQLRQVTSAIDPLGTPLRLTTAETIALLLALEAVEETPGLKNNNAAQSAANKIHDVVSDIIPIIDADLLPEQNFDCAPLLRQALREQKQVQLTYRGANGTVTERVVDPIQIVTDSNQNISFLKAADALDKSAIRKNFRFDRILDASLLDERARFIAPETISKDDPYGFQDQNNADQWGKVRVAANQSWILDYEFIYPPYDGAWEDDGPDVGTREVYEADIPMMDIDRTISVIMQHAPSMTAVEPVKLRKAVADRARAALAEYGQDQ